MLAPGWLAWFHALVACSWVPHWACHYFRLETRSTFQVGSWRFSRVDSVLALLVYGVLIGSNIAAVGISGVRFWVLLVSGLAHLSIGCLHLVRVARPFAFEVFGHAWSSSSSFREAALSLGFGVLCIGVAFTVARQGA